jgi:3-hydroxyacyl-CoA dehydrogenase/enoyl-CoA hydratase/3-hydroxybutyryl-CoA epimerase
VKRSRSAGSTASARRPTSCARRRWRGSTRIRCGQPWDRKDYRLPGGTPASPKIAAALAVAPAVLAQKTRGLYPATQAILEAMVEGALVDYDTAVRIEARKLAKVMVGQTAKNMIQAFFFDLQAIRSGKARPKGFLRGGRRRSASSAPA